MIIKFDLLDKKIIACRQLSKLRAFEQIEFLNKDVVCKTNYQSYVVF